MRRCHSALLGRGQIRRLDHVGPALRVGLYEIGGLRRRHGFGRHVEQFQMLLDVRRLEDVDDRGVELGDDRRWRLGGSRDRVPRPRLEVGHARFDEGRDVGQDRLALGGRDREDARLAGLVQLERRGHLGEHQVDVTRDEVVDGGRRAAVRHVEHADAGLAAEQLGGEMRGRAGSLRREIELVRIGARIGDEFLHGLGGKIRAHRQGVGDRGHDRDRQECGRVEIQLLVEQGVDGERRGLRGEQRVAVGLGGVNRLGPDIAGKPAAVLDHHRLAQALAQAVSHDAGDGIDAPAGRHADDDLDDRGGIIRGRIRLVVLAEGGHGEQQGREQRNIFHHRARSRMRARLWRGRHAPAAGAISHIGRWALSSGRGHIATGGNSGGDRGPIGEGTRFARLAGAVLGVPFRSRPAHVMQLRPVGIGEVAAQGPPQHGHDRQEPRAFGAGRGDGCGHGALCRLILRPAIRLNPWSPRRGPGFTSHDGSKFIKIYFQLIAGPPFSPTAFPLPCRRHDNCRQSRKPGLPWSVRPATSRLKIPTSRRGAGAQRPVPPTPGFRRHSGLSKRISRGLFMNGRQFVYHMEGLSKTYPGNRKVLENINLSFYPDAKIGVLGVNGSGKSTLLRIMAGLDKDYVGEGWVAQGARVGYLPQEPQLDPAKSVRDNVMEGVASSKAILDRYNELAMNYSDETADEMTKLQDEIEAKGLWDLDSKVDQAMDALRCPPDGANVETLSGGERRRVALCKLLLDQPELLLLDEPTNHLDAETVAWLEGHLRKYPGAILIVTHDRYFLDNVTGWILELDRGKGIPYEGNYSAWLSQKQKRLAQEGREDAAHQRTLAREQEWIAASPKARQAKSKARYQRYEELLKLASEKQTQTAQITIPVAERLGQNVIDFEGLTKGYGNNLLIDDLTFKLPPGGIVGVIGPNGAGKTTLFRMITGQEKPDAGTIKVGESVHLGYVDQSRDSLNAGASVWQEISGGLDQLQLGKREVNSRAYCGAFNFKGPDQQKKVGNLSGGERNRVHLAKMLKEGANLLLLDEPTNDLDVDTLRALEEALEDFAGCAVIITHDRWFLDRIATHMLAFEGDSEVVWFEGNYADYEADRHRRLGAEADQPHRIRYKPLTRA